MLREVVDLKGEACAEAEEALLAGVELLSCHHTTKMEGQNIRGDENCLYTKQMGWAPPQKKIALRVEVCGKGCWMGKLTNSSPLSHGSHCKSGWAC